MKHRIVVHVNAEELTYKGIPLLVHASVMNTAKWAVSSRETGLRVALGDCRDSAIKKAHRQIDSVPRKVLDLIIKERTLPPDRMITKKHYSILIHALGLDKNTELYRNHYCTSPGCDDYKFCERLVELGFMKKYKSPVSDDDCYIVTEKGKGISKVCYP